LPGPNALFEDVIGRLRAGPLVWRMLVTLGEPSDAVDDATVPWPADRRSIEIGTLTSADTGGPGNAGDMIFDPLILPPGIEPSGDLLLSARSAVYTASLRRRSGDPLARPAVTVDDVAS
jgi:catalase